jgi:hypothetical protein
MKKVIIVILISFSLLFCSCGYTPEYVLDYSQKCEAKGYVVKYRLNSHGGVLSMYCVPEFSIEIREKQ